MITDADIKKLKQVFATKDDLKAMEARQDKKYATKDDLKNGLAETKTAIVKEITDYLLEKTVGGFPPLAD